MAEKEAPAGGNGALRAARLKRGWRSGEAAARAVTAAGREALGDRAFEVSPRTWRRWESARPGWPRGDCARALYAAFGCWPEDLGFDTPPGWVRAEIQNVTGAETAGGPRHFAPSVTAAVTSGLVAQRYVDPSLIDYFAEQLEGHYRADMLLGPHDLIGTVSAQYALIDRLVRVATGETRQGLLRVGAAYAALVGWLHQDAGDLAEATFWRGVAQEVALRVQDPLLISYSLVNQAQVRTDLMDGPGVIDLCEAALNHRPNLPPKIRVMALQQQAHGASLRNDRKSCDRLLDQATSQVSRVNDELPWGNACRRTPGYLEVQRATCYGRLGLGKEAVALWSEVLKHVPSTARRDRGVYLARFAHAAALAREPDQATELAEQAVSIAVDTGSARMRRELAALRSAMRPWRDTRSGTSLEEVLTPVNTEE
ncbi:Twin-arginine translocation pathway signal [Streptomyces sp. AV19]|uniref:Twin-arginine translocation pathway signal n=1 Tax=Streptomyces sp. AV19 TaxID=2793068 RepID=UPI0018FEC2F7|nr:Twin-arginine translocation pathway signal [Streptomyces sp. AV19]MBH1938298.1 Twin-arginine translocation pathway signal [Streptomyces sp. AV19]MDG4534939.1 Twin-arginine translocation pathway signal [Streptomyces sp. AV19]